MEAINEVQTGRRPKVQHTEKEAHEKAFKICQKYAEAKNQLETICIHHKITARTFRRWINQYVAVRQLYNDAVTQLKEAKAEKMGLLAITGQEKLIKGAEYTTTEINETYDNDGNRTGYTKRTLTRILPPNVQMIKFTLANYDKKNCQLKPWGDDKHDNNSWQSKKAEPSLIHHEAEALKETEDYKEFLKWKEDSSLSKDVRYVRQSQIIYKEADITEKDSNESGQTNEINIESPSSIQDQTVTTSTHPSKTTETWKQATSPTKNEPSHPRNPEQELEIYPEPENQEIKASSATNTFILEFTEEENNTEINDFYARNEIRKMQLRQKHEEIRAAIENHQTDIDLSSLPITRAEFEALMHARWGNPSEIPNPDNAPLNNPQSAFVRGFSLGTDGQSPE